VVALNAQLLRRVDLAPAPVEEQVAAAREAVAA
jgi:hypothetical protein